MPPIPKPEVSDWSPREPKDGEEIVITGMAGRFPKSKNIKEFKENLYSKVDMLSESSERWDFQHPELPPKLGMIHDTNVFDYQYFMINGKQANSMEPVSRILLECSCEAVIDAGINPQEIKNSKTGVFIGGSISECEMYCNLGSKYIDTYALSGSARAMFSNRVSYYLGILGPSYTTDSADTSGAAMLEHAYKAMTEGDCDAALVGCPNLCMHPYRNINLSRMGLLSKDGRTRCFCDDADGCGRADSVVVVFLQKAKDAKRIYAELVNAKSLFTDMIIDNKMNFRYPDAEKMSSFLKQFYNQVNVDPETVKYVEAYGAGIKEVDKSEIESIDRVFCNKQRTEPLMIGSVKSNIGNAEMASDLCSLVKVLLGYQSKEIAPNYGMDKPRSDIEAIYEGRVRLANEPISFAKGYTAINCLSIFGNQGHILLKDYQTPQVLQDSYTELAQLVCVSGRVDESLEETFLDLESKPLNYQQIALLRSINELKIPGFMNRGYTLMTTKGDKTICLQKARDVSNGDDRPVWFIYSGMGAQWPAMGKHLMKIPVFAQTITKLHKVLEQYDLDLINIITSDDPTIFQNILNCFVGNASVQFALTDVLHSVGIVADNMIGHSGGEIACAYADGCITAEEAILISYCRGLVSLNTPFAKGLMAAVGLGYNAIKNMLPPTVEVACHNGPNSCTISGPYEAVKEYVKTLTEQGIFAKEVDSNNIAYHSQVIKIGADLHTKYMRDIIKVPKLRSSRWIPTAIPPEKWNDPVLKYCSPEYLTNNFTDPVLFEEGCRLIRPNAIAIEIAPHGLMQAILKRSLSPECLNIPLTKRGHEDNSVLVLSALGKLFLAGLQPKIQNLYTPVQFPVPADTPLLSNICKWNHTDNLKCSKFLPGDSLTSSERLVTLTVKDQAYNYLKGYEIEGVNYVAPSALLVLVWETLGMVLGIPYRQMSVEFQYIRIDTDVELGDNLVDFNVVLQRASGVFEIAKDGVTVISGKIEAKKRKLNKSGDKSINANEKCQLTAGEIYRTFALQGYNYRGVFRSLKNMSQDFTKAEIQWRNNWTAFIDGVIQLGQLSASKTAMKPKYIQSIVIDVVEQELAVSSGHVQAVCDTEIKTIRCAGVELRDLEFVNHTKPKRCLPSIMTQQPIEGQAADETSNYQLSMTDPGNLDSFVWIQKPATTPKPNKVMVQIHYTRIAYADLMKAQNRQIPGQLETESKSFGTSFSGITESGDRVMGLVGSGAASNYVEVDSSCLWKVPNHWTLEEAATVPQAYAQAFYCLFDRKPTPLNPEKKVLVTSGAGALGQAVINVCLAHGCDVFTTVSDANKKRILLKLFPNLKESNICNLKEENVSDVVLGGTDGKGCDIIISAAQGNERVSVIQCCTTFASFFDIGIEDLVESGQFGMAFLNDDKSYIVTMFSNIFNEANLQMRINFQEKIYEGIEQGWVRPISHVVFESSETSKAFKLISTRRNHGAVLLRLQNKQQLIPTVPSFKGIDGTYVVICGRRNIGLEIADKLVNLGANKIVIGCSDGNSAYLRVKLKCWQKKGVQIGLSPANFTNPTAYIDFLTTATNLGSVRGLFIVNNIKTTKNIDDVTRTLFPNLQYFVAVEYKEENVPSEIEKLCANRSKAGFPSTVISCKTKKNQNENEDIVYEQMASCLNEKLVNLEMLLVNNHDPIKKVADDKPIEIDINEIMDLIGVDAQNDVDYTDLTLEHMNVTLTSAKTLSLLLNVKYELTCEPRRLLKMKLVEIKDLMQLKKQKTRREGYSLFFSKFNRFEIDASEPYVWAETRLYKDLKVTEHSEGENYLIVLPGVEGNAESLFNICRQLKLRALVCQYSANNTTDTVKELAEELTEIISRRIGIKSKFYLLGYEYGGILALEMALILERKGLQGKVFCLNSSPLAAKNLVQTQTNSIDDQKQQNQYLLHMSSLMSEQKGTNDQLSISLSKENEWSKKVDCCLRHLRTKTSSTTEYLRNVINSGWKRLSQMKSYSSKLQLNSPIVLIKESSFENIPEDYGLQQYSSVPISVYSLDTRHEDLLKDVSSANIVNQELDEDVLKKFYEANLCLKYSVLSL